MLSLSLVEVSGIFASTNSTVHLTSKINIFFTVQKSLPVERRELQDRATAEFIPAVL